MSEHPLVSVCIPVYNGEQYLEEALHSVLNQVYRPLEIIVSDDGSTDHSLQIVRDFAEKSDVNIHIFNHEPKGIGANWNHCVQQAKGKYIKFLFQDDLLVRTCIEEMVAFAEQHDNKLGLIFSARELIGDLTQINPIDYAQLNHMPVFDGKEILKDKNLYAYPRNKIGEPSSVLIPVEIFKEVGYFNTQLKQSLDYEFWYRICHSYKLGYIPKKLVQFRIHASQTTQINSVNVTTDRYKLPYLLLKEHFTLLHLKTRCTLLYKMITGIIALSWYKLRHTKS